MKIFNNLNEWRYFRTQLPSSKSIGFVPTMGNLHLGHASLYEQSCKENDLTIASIFINPTQFNRAEDFKHYPRTLEADLHLLEKLGVNYCLLPTEQEIYPDDYHYQLQENHLSLLMEGAHRPGHFTGVLTIVMKLLNLVKPNCAYFGEKDYQQLELIREMVHAFFMDINIKACPTIREASNLAYSSRNNRLTSEQRIIANKFAHLFHQTDIPEKELRGKLEALGVIVEYIEDYENRRYIAIKIGEVRLIDNYQK